MLAITILRERTGHWTRMLRSLARFSRSDASCRTPWLAGCITNMSGFRFSARTGRDLERGRRGYRATALHLCRPRRPDWRRERIVGRALPRAACETLIQFSKGPCPSMKSLRWPLITRAGIWREVLEFVRLPLPLLRVRRGRFFDRNIWPDSCVFRIKRQPFLKPGFAISLDGIDGAFRFANATVDAFVRVDDEHVLALVEAVHGAHLDAVHGFAAN